MKTNQKQKVMQVEQRVFKKLGYCWLVKKVEASYLKEF